MRTSAAQTEYSGEQVLFLAIETSSKQWKVGTKTQLGQRMREKTITAWDEAGLRKEIERAKEHWGLPGDARVVSCYEAGRDGFSVHRLMTRLGAENDVVDPGSIEVSRKFRRAKTDRVDLRKLTDERVRTFEGEKRWSVCRVPTVPEEDARQLHRELQTLKAERIQHRNRIQSLLVTQGIRDKLQRDFAAQLDRLRCPDGTALAPEMRSRMEREWARLQLVQEQLRSLYRERRERLRSEKEDPQLEPIRQLMQLRGIGEETAWRLGRELFSWRRFDNRRQLAAFVGLSPTPHQSGTMDLELGISKAGSTWVRPLMIEIAWQWLLYQPNSQLSRWYRDRFVKGRRSRKVGIVALARKLLVALWRYVEQGREIEGAVLKPGART